MTCLLVTHLSQRGQQQMRALYLGCLADEVRRRSGSTPIFSADGRHFAIRGNAYENSLEVFEFPSLDRVLATTLGEPNPGYPYPQEWLEQMRAWSRHNISFGVQPGVLWVGTPTGALVEVDLDNQHVVKHDVLAGSSVTGLGATATASSSSPAVEAILHSCQCPPPPQRSMLRTATCCRP